MKTEIKQWEKRVIVFKFVYSYLMNDWDDCIYRQKSNEEEVLVDEYISKILVNISESKNKYLNALRDNIAKEWTIDRISMVDKAIILSACGEFFTHKVDRKIIIDEAIKTSKKYSDENSFKFINSILDKIL